MEKIPIKVFPFFFQQGDSHREIYSNGNQTPTNLEHRVEPFLVEVAHDICTDVIHSMAQGFSCKGSREEVSAATLPFAARHPIPIKCSPKLGEGREGVCFSNWNRLRGLVYLDSHHHHQPLGFIL